MSGGRKGAGRVAAMRDSRTTMVVRQRRKERAQPMQLVSATPEQVAFWEGLYKRLPGVVVETQEQRLLMALRDGPLTTAEACRHLDIACPRARASSLRRQGYQIAMTWVLQHGPQGALHRYGQYSLTVPAGELPGGEKGAP